jgi:hypothetical protein
MCIKTGEAEKTGDWESPIWILRWIEEKASAAKTTGAEETGERQPSIRIPGRIEEKASAAERLRGFLNDENSAP